MTHIVLDKKSIVLLEYFKNISLILLFIWILFFAPLIRDNLQYVFLVILTCLLVVFFYFDKSFYKLIFDKERFSIWVFLFTMIGGMVIAIDPALSYKHFRLFIFPIPLLFFFTRSTFKERYVLFITRWLCAIALCASFLGILELIAKQNFIYEHFVNNMYYSVFKGRRMMLTQLHPTPLSTYFLAMFPLSVALYYHERKTLFRVFPVISIIFILIGVILTFSRGAIFGILIEAFFMTILLGNRRKLWLVICSVILFMLIVGTSLLFFHSSDIYFHRYSLRGLSSPYLYWGKIERFMSLASILKDHPFLGIGFGHFRTLFNHYLPNLANFCSYDSKVADCMYITILAETGLLGFGGFLFFIFSFFKQVSLNLALNTSNEYKVFLVCFWAGLIGMMCGFLTYDGLYWLAPSYLFWSYAGILANLSSQKSERN